MAIEPGVERTPFVILLPPASESDHGSVGAA